MCRCVRISVVPVKTKVTTEDSILQSLFDMIINAIKAPVNPVVMAPAARYLDLR